MEIFSNKKKNIKKLPNPQREMGFLEHLEELRWTIFRSLLTILIFAIGVFIAKDFVFNNIISAHLNENFPTYRFFCWFGERMCFHPPELKLITRVMGEQFFVHIKVSLVLGFIFAFPFVLREVWKFVSPGLQETERKATFGVITICSFLFFLGVSFGFFVIAPFAIKFFAEYTVGSFAETSPTLDSYVGFITMLTLPAGIIFELPVVVYFLTKAGLVDVAFLRTYRRHAIIIILVLSAIITPPDVLTQILIGIPILFIYEIGILVAKRVEKKAKQNE